MHEAFVVNGRPARLKNRMDHYSYRSLKDAMQKMNNYSTLEARQKYQNKRVSPLILLYILPAAFFQYFIVRKAKDGKYGLMVSSTPRNDKYADLYENMGAEENGEPGMKILLTNDARILPEVKIMYFTWLDGLSLRGHEDTNSTAADSELEKVSRKKGYETIGIPYGAHGKEFNAVKVMVSAFKEKGYRYYSH